MANFWDSAPAVSPLDAALQLEDVSGPLANLARSIYQQESGSGANTMTSNAGAVGGMQILPGTFKGVADAGWNIDDPVDNARAGVRYLGQMLDAAGGDPRLAAAGYYGGPGGLEKARSGVAVSDPRNPGAPTTLQYADQVAGRIGKLANGVAAAVLPAAQAGELPKNWWEAAPLADDAPWKNAPLADPEAPTYADGKGDAVTLHYDQPSGITGGALGGLAMGLRDPIDAGAQMLRRMVPDSIGDAVDAFGNKLADMGLPVAHSNGVAGVDSLINQVNAEYDAARKDAGRSGFDAWRLGGNLLGVAPLLSATPSMAGASLITRLGAGALQGGLLGMSNPVIGEPAQADFGGTKLHQGLLGTAFGAATPLAAAGLGRMISPLASQPGSAAQLLRAEGIDLTPGQVAGGAAMRTEDKLMSVPILGDAIRAARNRANDQFNRAVYNRVLAPLGESTTATGRQAIDDVSNRVSNFYDRLLGQVQFRPDAQFVQDLAQLQQMARQLPAEEARQFTEALQREVIGPLSKSVAVDGRTFKDIEAQLGERAQRFLKATDTYQNDVGYALQEAQAALRRALMRANPGQAHQLQRANQAFAQLTRLQDAGAKVGANDGVFTPAQFSSAVRAGDKTVRHNAYARGNALMQDLSDAGRDRMMSQIPNSGTTDRLLLNAGALGSAAVSPTIPLSLAAASIPYLPLANKIAPLLLGARPAAAPSMAAQLQRVSPGLLGILAK